MDENLALRIQARAIRATWDKPRSFGGGIVPVLTGLAIAIGAMLAISYAGGHAGNCLRFFAEIARNMRVVLEGG
jgi:hypothetical protein